MLRLDAASFYRHTFEVEPHAANHEIVISTRGKGEYVMKVEFGFDDFKMKLFTAKYDAITGKPYGCVSVLYDGSIVHQQSWSRFDFKMKQGITSHIRRISAEILAVWNTSSRYVVYTGRSSINISPFKHVIATKSTGEIFTCLFLMKYSSRKFRQDGSDVAIIYVKQTTETTITGPLLREHANHLVDLVNYHNAITRKTIVSGNPMFPNSDYIFHIRWSDDMFNIDPGLLEVSAVILGILQADALVYHATNTSQDGHLILPVNLKITFCTGMKKNRYKDVWKSMRHYITTDVCPDISKMISVYEEGHKYVKKYVLRFAEDSSLHLARVTGWLPASTSNVEDKNNKPCDIWKITYISSNVSSQHNCLKGTDEELEEHELLSSFVYNSNIFHTQKISQKILIEIHANEYRSAKKQRTRL